MRRIVSQLISACMVLMLLLMICLALLRAVPGGPFDNERIAAPEVQAALAEKFGTNASYWSQLWRYSKGALQGDLGPSFQYTDFSVAELLTQALPITLLIGAVALLLAWGLALPVALYASAAPNSWADKLLRLGSTGLLATPKFVTAPLLALVFAVWLGLLPSAGLGEPLWRYVVLPALALALTQFGVAARVLRGALLSAEKTDALKAARARGFAEARLKWRHRLPIALPNAGAFLLPSAIAVLTGSAVVEQVFALPGLGRALLSAALNRDYTLLLGVVLCCGVIVLLIAWLVELLLLCLDPRRRAR
jgi:oligopeptide transport system permease protein